MFKQLQLYILGGAGLVILGLAATVTVQTLRYRAADARADRAEAYSAQLEVDIDSANKNAEKNRIARDRALDARDAARDAANGARDALAEALDSGRENDETLDACLGMRLPDDVLRALP